MSFRERVDKLKDRLQVPRAHSLPRTHSQESVGAAGGGGLSQMVQETMYLVLPAMTSMSVRRHHTPLQRSNHAVEYDDGDVTLGGSIDIVVPTLTRRCSSYEEEDDYR